VTGRADVCHFYLVNAIIYAMKLRIDKLGRIVVPKPIRKNLGLDPEAELEVEELADGILLRPVSERPSMVKIDGLWVHTGNAEPDARWEDVVERVRDERIEDLLKSR
jgi:AbrB family looped-hinge helix DNA binding protein